jgi:uroporphyrinogen-III synthase
VDALVFTSASTVRHFAGVATEKDLERVKVVCIGPITGRAAEDAGLAVAAVAAEHSGAGLAATLAALFAGDPGERGV